MTRYQQGFSLIELMISITIGVVILLGLTILYSVNTTGQRANEQVLQRMENIRYASEILTEDLLHAGYYSDVSTTSLSQGVTYTSVDPCAKYDSTYTPTPATMSMGWNSENGVNPAKFPAAILGVSKDDTTTNCLANRLSGTAAIVVRHAQTDAGLTITASSDPTTAGDLYMQISQCSQDTNRILVSPGPSSNFTNNTIRDSSCTSNVSTVRRLMQRVYYIASCDDCTGSGDGIPTLKRLEYINGTAQILSVAEGIENMQFEYGQDTDGDGVPDTYFSDTSTISSALPAAWAQITAIKVNLLGRDLTSTGGYTDTRTYKLGPVTITTPSDGYKRTLNASTVRLNNVAGRLE